MKLSEGYTWVVYSMACVGAVEAAWAMVPRWRRGCCAGCGYDLRGLGGKQCPECGGRSSVRGYRPRWALLLVGAILMLPGLTWWQWREAVRHAYWWVRYPRWALTSESQGGPFVLRMFNGGRPDVQLQRRFTLSREGHEFFHVDDVMLADFPEDLREQEPWPGVDLTGDGVPELLLGTYSGGAHCCSDLLVFDVSGPPVLIATIATLHTEASFSDLDCDSVFEVELLDWNWAYWHTSFVESPAPKVILVWNGKEFVPAPEKMRSEGASTEDLIAAGARIDERINQVEEVRGISRHQFAELWKTMLTLMYSGRVAEAWWFFELAWPKRVEGKETFRSEFEDSLAQSNYWPRIAPAFGADACGRLVEMTSGMP